MDTMSFNQLATVLNSIQKQATGKNALTATDTASFVSCATTTLRTGYDPVLSAVSQILSKTIFSVRPYSRKFAGLRADAIRYGNHVRKLVTLDKDFEEDDRIKLTDGEAVDQYVVNKPKVLQTNFYGENVYQKSMTIFRDQLDSAFSGPEQFGSFISMVMQNASDMIEQAHENTARATVANFIAGKFAMEDNVVYLLDLYDAETGATSTAASIKQPENFVPFCKWLMAYLRTQSDLMTERSIKFHKNFTINTAAVDIPRHTPIANQKLYIYSKDLNDMDASVLSSVFHDKYLKIMDHERVNFFQSIETPTTVKAKPAYNDTDGTVINSTDTVTVENILGVLFDEEAIGYTVINEWSQPAVFNARGGYSNIFWHFTDRFWNDYSENAIVLLLDHAPTGTRASTAKTAKAE